MCAMESDADLLDLVRSGRITAEQGAWLYELRRELAWRRLPLLERFARIAIALLIGGRP